MEDKTIFSKSFLSLRKNLGLTQEKIAGMLGVSRQAVQKWENGTSMPDAEKLIEIAGVFDVSLDYLIRGKDNRSTEELRTKREMLPSFNLHPWEAYYKEMPTEYQQTFEEGKDVEKYKNLMYAIAGMPDGKAKSDMADIIFGIIEELPQRADYKYEEPSDLEGIFNCSRRKNHVYKRQSAKVLEDRIKGAWYGRICGCLLGKSIEGIRRSELIPFLKATGNYPMKRYITKSDAENTGDLKIGFPIAQRAYPDGIMDGMPVDDDTNYIMMAYLLVKQYGKDFTPADDARHWLWNQPKDAYCTAERVAFRNFVNGYYPPDSASYKNPYREWIGAQIRGDFFGWINPGRPEKAAEMAWKDGCISHIKNGIYGEMWVSAMLAAAAGGASIGDSIRIGMEYIPEKSRLFEALEKVLDFYGSGKTSDEFFEDFHKRWDDCNGHHWCHTISNAEIVAASLLWGEGDYGKSVCLAVQQGFDTDCNGATVGSVIGIANGFSSIPSVWTDKISGTLFTTIFNHEKVSVNEMAKKTMELI